MQIVVSNVKKRKRNIKNTQKFESGVEIKAFGFSRCVSEILRDTLIVE